MRDKYGDNAEKVCGAMEKKMASDITETFEDNGKFYIKAFLLDSSVNQNAWGVDPATLEQNISTYIGKPLVLQDDFEHPNSGDSNFDHHIQYQEKFRIGNIIDVVNKDSIYSAIIEVTDPVAKQAFKVGDLPLYVSPQLFHDGVGKEPDTAARTWRGTHLAVVKEPAFGIMKARIEGQCSGDSNTCLAQLKKANIEKTNCNCVKQAIANFTGKNVSSLFSSEQKSVILADKDNANPPAIQSSEELAKLQAALEAANAKVSALEGTNKQLTEENKTVSASLDNLKGEYRKDKVTSLLSGVFYSNDEERNKAIESFTKSNMSYDEIVNVTNPLKKASVEKKAQDTKLVIKEASSNEDSNEIPYWLRINQHIVGAAS